MTEIYKQTQVALKRNETLSQEFRRKTEKRQQQTVRDTLSEILTTGDSKIFGNILSEYQRLIATDQKELTQTEIELETKINDKLTYNFGTNGAEFIVREWIQKPSKQS